MSELEVEPALRGRLLSSAQLASPPTGEPPFGLFALHSGCSPFSISSPRKTPLYDSAPIGLTLTNCSLLTYLVLIQDLSARDSGFFGASLSRDVGLEYQCGEGYGV